MSSQLNEKQKLAPVGARPTARRSVHPSAREVSLAKLLLQLIDVLGTREDLDSQLYNDVKSFAEPIVREAKDGV